MIKICELIKGVFSLKLNNLFRKKFLLLLICIFLYTVLSTYNNSYCLSNDDFIRFHVIANSDSAEDQQLKLKVRDEVLAKINSEMVQEAMARQDGETAVLDLDSSRAYLLNNLSEIEDLSESVIRRNGYDYEAKAELGIKWIPEKTYGEVTFPAGNYEALNITIGEGKGQNWWCVLFPPLCLIGAESPDNEKSRETKEIYNEIIVSKKYDAITQNHGKPTTLKLKFKSLEIIDELNK